MHAHNFEAIGTLWSIETSRRLDQSTIRAIDAFIDSFDRAFSRFRSDSLVQQAAREGGAYTFSVAGAAKLFHLYETLWKVTRGKVNPLVGGLLEDMGYDSRYSLKDSGRRDIVPVPSDVYSRHGNQLTFARPALLDVGAAGKGCLVDEIALIIERQGIADYIIDASGDIKHRGSAAQQIGLEHPYKADSVVGYLNVANASLCASATNRRAWGEGLHHVVDPVTREPTHDVVATWVVARDTMTADGLATALFFTDPEELLKHFSFLYVRYMQSGKLDHSPHLSGELYS